MKILHLSLTAFGPFTGRVLDLSGGSHGLHVIFGPNEAGKSSALRALHALLFGIPGQTDDAFLHPYGKLRIGARLRLSSGDEIEFARRKGNKGTLLGPSDERLDDHVLDRFLGAVGPEQFRMFWGIDHAHLVEGGRQILEGHGDVGEILFAAGSGASGLGTLRRKLEDEAAALFTPRARNRPVNQAVRHLRELRRAQREVTVSSDAWVRRERAAKEANEHVGKLAEHLQKLTKEKSRLERLTRVVPRLAEREEVLDRLRDLGDVVLLAPDFPQRRQEAETTLYMAEQHLERRAGELREQEEAFGKLPAKSPLATEAEAINDLYRRLGGHRKASDDRPGLVRRRDEQLALAKRLLGDLRPDLDIDTADTLRVFVGRRERIQKLAAERERLDERLASAQRLYRESQEQAAALLHDASSLPPARGPALLVAAIEEARRHGDAEVEREKRAQTAMRIAAQRDASIEKLQLSGSVIDRLERLRVPTAAAIARFERRAQELEDEDRTAKIDHQRLTREKRELGAKIQTLRTTKAIPSEADLAAARTLRNRAFALLRDHWEKGRDVSAEVRRLLGAGELIDLYVDAVTSADEVADRLRSEADRVAELAQCLEELERNGREMEEEDVGSQGRQKAVQELDAAWREAWRPVLAAPPQIHDARAWREDFARLLERTNDAGEALQAQRELAAWIEMQIESLHVAVAALEPGTHRAANLAVALTAAEALRQRVEKEERVRAEHVRKTGDTELAIRNAEVAIQEAQTDIGVWQNKWDDATRGLRRSNAPPPDDALVALDRIDRILRALDDAAGYDARISGIDRDADSFRSDVRALAERIGEVEIEAGFEDTWVASRHKRLAAVLKEDERRRQALERIEGLRIDVESDGRAVETAGMTLGSLREEARCGADQDLLAMERRSADCREWRKTLTRIEKELVRDGAGASITDLEKEAADVDLDTTDTRIVQIAAELPEIDNALSTARDARANAQAELSLLRGPSAASEKAEDVQATLARLRDDIIRYSRLRLASTLLSRRIDDYRHRNQAPLLLRAGALFRAMTLQSFERLEADEQEDRPILVGLRPDGARVPADGMSEGTRDQLFFALRLAAVEASSIGGEPMPFVVDDVLVQFDDNRCAAALDVLADVASRTQVVLFTHHRQVRMCAEALDAPAGVIVHEL